MASSAPRGPIAPASMPSPAWNICSTMAMGLDTRLHLRHAREKFAVPCRQATGRAVRAAGELLEEHRLRERAALPGDFLDHLACCSIVSASRVRGAIVSAGCGRCRSHTTGARAARGLAVARGARLFEGEAVCIRCRRTGGRWAFVSQVDWRDRGARVGVSSDAEPAMSYPMLVQSTASRMRCRRAGRSQPCRSRKTSGRMTR